MTTTTRPLAPEAAAARLQRIDALLNDLLRETRSLASATSLAGEFEPRSIPEADVTAIRRRLFDLGVVLNGVEVA